MRKYLNILRTVSHETFYKGICQVVYQMERKLCNGSFLKRGKSQDMSLKSEVHHKMLTVGNSEVPPLLL